MSIQGLRSFFSDRIWEIDDRSVSWFQKIFLYIGRVLSIIAKGLAEHKLPIRSTALAYTTLLSIAPLLAVTFSLFKAFGGLEKTVGSVKMFIYSNLTAGAGQAAAGYLDQFVEKYRSGTIGFVGFILLVFTVIALLTTIEKAFNDIWGVPKSRSFIKRFTAYWSLITMGPVLLGVSLTVTGALQSSKLVNQILTLSGAERFFLSKIPWLTTWALFSALYLIMPNTKVRLRSALIGGILGGTLWEIAKWGYTLYAAKVVTYSKIYGSLGIIPIFLIWIYYTWVVVLIGAEIAFADQHLHTYRMEKRVGRLSYELKEKLALFILQVISGEFYHHQVRMTASDLAERAELPVRVVNEITYELVQGGFLVGSGDDDEEQLLPAAPLSQILISDVIRYLRREGDQKLEIPEGPERARLEGLLASIQTAVVESAKGMTLETLVGRP